MKKTEKNIIVNEYWNILGLINEGFDKEDARISIKKIMLLLDMENEATIVENSYWLKNQNFDNVKKAIYEQGQEYLLKYTNKVCSYDYLDEALENLSYEVSEDTSKCLWHIINIIRG